MQKITSSVIIPTRNRINDLVNALQSIEKQTIKPDEIVIIDSSDIPMEQNKTFQHIRKTLSARFIYKHTNPGAAYQRNVGARLASGELFYFFDDDVILQTNFIEQMNKIFEQYPQFAGGMGTVSGIPEKRNSFFRLLRILFLLQRDHSSGNFTWSGMPTHAYGLHVFKPVHVLGGCCMAFRSHYLKKEFFDEKLGDYSFMEDCDLSFRVSRCAPLFYNPAAVLNHVQSPLNRDSIAKYRQRFIYNYSYLFFKNFYPNNKLKIIAYCWSIIGLFIEAILLRNKDYLKGYWRGLKQYYFDK